MLTPKGLHRMGLVREVTVTVAIPIRTRHRKHFLIGIGEEVINLQGTVRSRREEPRSWQFCTSGMLQWHSKACQV